MYDVCIVGGGINGVAIAELCGNAGLRTVLIEQRQLGSGASTKTSKLAHGGLRYLEQFQIGLVRESLRERDRLLQLYPTCVKPLPFILPIFKGESTLKMWCGMKLYDFLSSDSQLPKSKKLTVDQIQQKLPWLKTDNILHGYLFYDAVMDDVKVLDQTARAAKRSGVEIREHEKVHTFSQEGDYISIKTEYDILDAKVIINATGAWSNQFFFRDKDIVTPSKGAHIATKKLYTEYATVLRTPEDNRVFFTIPFYDTTIIGTTDTLYTGDLNNVEASAQDIDYIIRAINQFTKQYISPDDIQYTYAGLRPLAASDQPIGSATRGVTIRKLGRAFSLVGGKYTTHRAIAAKMFSMIKQYV